MRSRSTVWILAVPALLFFGCTWWGYIPKEKVELPPTSPRPLETLTLGVPHDDVLDCGDDDCNHWYRLDIAAPGVLRIAVDAAASDDDRITRVLLRVPQERVLAQAVGIRGEPLRIEHAVEPGLYGVLVQGGGAERSYRVTATLEAAAP